jgi:AAA family ATP:ADP antiporter
VSFVVLAFTPTLPAIVAAQVATRGFNFGISNPARHVLFSIVTLDEKYKAQNVIDTLVQRGGDAAGGWLVAMLLAWGVGLAAISSLAAPVAGLVLVVSLGLGRMHKRLSANQPVL